MLQVIDAYSKLKDDVDNHVVNSGTSVTKQIGQLTKSMYGNSLLNISDTKTFVDNLRAIYSNQVAYIVEGFANVLQNAAGDVLVFEMDVMNYARIATSQMDTFNNITVTRTHCWISHLQDANLCQTIISILRCLLGSDKYLSK